MSLRSAARALGPCAERTTDRGAAWRTLGNMAQDERSSMRTRTGLSAALLAALLALSGTAAWATEAESGEAAVLVLQAVSLLANDNTPDAILQRIEDALQATVTEGADLAQVEQAKALVEPVTATDARTLPPDVKAQVRRLLEQSLGTPEEAASPAMVTGIETGTSRVLDKYRPARGVSGGGDAALLVLAALAVALGLLLARRLRPHHSLRELRRGVTPSSPKEPSA